MLPVRFVCFACLISVLHLVTASAADVPPPTGDRIVAPDAKLELLYTRSAKIKGGLTEGPGVAPDGSIYFTDIPSAPDKGLIVRFDPRTKRTTVFTDDSGMANGLIFDKQGDLISCEGSDSGGRCVSRWDVRTGRRSVIVADYRGKRFNAPNDVCVDRAGRIYFTDPRYLGDEPRELAHRAVYCVDTDGSVFEVTHDISKPNGIAISPDGRTLYVADHDNGTDKIDPTQPPPQQGRMSIESYPLTSEGRVEGRRKTLIDFGSDKGCDGMCVDEQGNLYLTIRADRRPGVLVVDQEGREVAFIPTGPSDQKPTAENPPAGLPSNVEFGIGKESNVLYVTIDLRLYRIPLKVNGYHVQYEN